MAPLKTAVLGIGNSANTFHIPYLLALPELYTLHSIYERKATKEKSKGRDLYGHLGTKVVTTLEEVLEDKEVDLVIVAVKGQAHYDYTKAALSAGKNVVLEKPVTSTAEEVRDLIEIAKEKKVVFAPYHNRRFDGDFRTVRQLIKEGKLNDLVDFESRYDVAASWGVGSPGPGAGITFGLGSHLIDQAIALFGKPKSVTALLDNGRRLGDPDYDDSFIVHLRYADNPVLVTLRSALHSVMSHQVRFIVRGLKSSFVKYGLDVQEPQAKTMKPTDKGFGEDPEEFYGEYSVLEGDKTVSEKVKTLPGVYIDYYRNVSDAIRGKAPLEVTGEQAELGIAIIIAAHKSHQEKKTVEL